MVCGGNIGRVHYEQQIMKAIPNTPNNERNRLASMVDNLFMNTGLEDKRLFDCLLNIPKNQRRGVIEHAQMFIVADLSTTEKCTLLNTIVSISEASIRQYHTTRSEACLRTGPIISGTPDNLDLGGYCKDP